MFDATRLLQTLTDALSLGSLYALIAIGYTMVYGVLRLINFAHGEIFMIAMYIVFYGIDVYKRQNLRRVAFRIESRRQRRAGGDVSLTLSVCLLCAHFQFPSKIHHKNTASSQSASRFLPKIRCFFQFFMFGNGALPHRPTKGLSERLRRPFGASPFGNLRAQILRFTLEISVL